MQDLDVILAQYALNASYEGARGTIVQATLKAWHMATERNPLQSSVHVQYRAVLQSLMKHSVVDLRVVCPLVDAIHFRISDAVTMFVDAALDRQSTHVGLSPAALADCLMEQDIFGETVLHVAAKAKASGFARLFLRLRQLNKRRSADSSDPDPAQAIAPTLELLKLKMIDFMQPITFNTLNDATTVRNRASIAFDGALCCRRAIIDGMLIIQWVCRTGMRSCC